MKIIGKGNLKENPTNTAEVAFNSLIAISRSIFLFFSTELNFLRRKALSSGTLQHLNLLSVDCCYYD